MKHQEMEMAPRAAGYVLIAVACALATTALTLMAGGSWVVALVLYPVGGLTAIVVLIAWALVLDHLRCGANHREELEEIAGAPEAVASHASPADPSSRPAAERG